MAARVLELLDWLAAAAAKGEPATVFGQLCERIRGLGIPLDRAAIQLDNLHPLFFGYCLHWYAGQPGYEVPRSHDFARSDEFALSPYKAALNGGGFFRWRLDREPEPGLPLIRQLAAGGFTDYFTVILDNGSAVPPGIGWATAAPGGFDEDAFFVLRSLSPHLGAPFGLAAERRKLAAVMATYLGRGPAADVLAGRVERGDLRRLDAVVLLADLRGFSRLASEADEATLIGTLDGYCDAVASAVAAHGGDVLKFIGDGILAVFAYETEEALPRRARDAAAAVAAARAAFDRPMTAVLHAGPVAFGNVGARERLDFTVIGPAINVASRLEAVAKALDVETVATGRVAAHLRPAARSLGRHRLRGMPDEVELFGL